MRCILAVLACCWLINAHGNVTLYLPEDEMAALNEKVLQHPDLLPEERIAAQKWLDSGIQSWPVAPWASPPCARHPTGTWVLQVTLNTTQTVADLLVFLRTLRARTPTGSDGWIQLRVLEILIQGCARNT